MLYCESSGAGPDVVLLHGWGWHGGLWDDVGSALARDHRVWILDLPGHGHNRGCPVDFHVDVLAQSIGERVPENAVWVGWSLGGLVALAAARLGIVRRLVLVGTTPRFLRGIDWECGLSSEWFDRFSHDLVRDAPRALERFASLHLAGGAGERTLLRRLRTELVRHGLPDVNALHAGLRVLQESDARAWLGAISVPALVWHGTRDQIALPAAGERLAGLMPRGQFVCVDDAGHAGFLSHPHMFLGSVREFLRE